MKFLNLIRCFRNLSFLVMMIEQVIIDSGYFFCLFFVFVLTFAECYNILNVDVGVYKRQPSIFGQCFNALRSAMGDLALIDPFESFDIKEKPPYSSTAAAWPEPKYRHSLEIVYFTFLIFILGQFFLFMIFMNFIIAVINESYNKINDKKLSYDYLQKVKMIYEKEAHFREKDLANNIYFPAILVVRKRKLPDNFDQGNLEN